MLFDRLPEIDALSMLLIATDEAGYGPKLGPLVIAATAWKLPSDDWDHDLVDAAFAPLRRPGAIGTHRIRIDDSKAVYRSGGGLAALHAVVSASNHWRGRSIRTVAELLRSSAADDWPAIERTAWLGTLSDEAFADEPSTRSLVSDWRSAGAELIDVAFRVLTASTFNALCDRGCNKADLLSESTVGLIRSLLDRNDRSDDVDNRVLVHCDRHGGRRYYAGVLQHVFGDAPITVTDESRQRSGYRLSVGDKTVEIAFTVKGDSFTPVALTSLHAKYLRERLMEAFNAYFSTRHAAQEPFRATAGYPGDADRFLAQIRPIVERLNIRQCDLIRSR